MKEFDLIIIGAGRASNLAITASNLGKKVALIEKSSLGGSCPNRGCVPSKLLIGYAHKAREIQESQRHFIDSSINLIDVKKIFEETNSYISKVDSNYLKRLNENITLFRGVGKFVSNNIVEVNDNKLSAPIIVIATGTRPLDVPHKMAWSSDNIFPLKGDVPKSITIVGAGFIAVELANFFDAVGVETKLIVRSNTLLPKEDREISEIFKQEFTKNVETLFNTEITNINYENETFKLKLINKKEQKETTIESTALLYAIGRKSNADLLSLENTDIKVNERGFIIRDENFQTTVKGVYVVGDASGFHMLQHAAAFEVNHLGKYLFKDEKSPLHFKYMPHAVFTNPEVASVGYTQQELEELNKEYVSVIVPWLASAKAMSLRINYPRTKLIVNPKNYEILGAHLVGPDSATMIHQILAVMHINNDARHLKDMLYIHPALSEALLAASVEVVKKVNEYNK